MKQVFILLCIIFVIFSCPINGEDGDKGKRGKNGETKVIEVKKELTTVTIYEGEVPSKEQIINLSDYLEEDQEVYLVVYNLNTKKLLCPEKFIFNYKLDNFDWESETVKDSKQVDLVVKKDSIIKWNAFGNNIKVELIY